MLWGISFFNYADRQAIFSVFPLLEKEMGLTTVQLGLLGSSFAWVYGLGAPFAGVQALVESEAQADATPS
jgi:predicted MFS family arabinose efflux permease